MDGSSATPETVCTPTAYTETVREAAEAIAYWAGTAPRLERLPWREDRTPYRVFLAEFLLARTRADVVARVFCEVLERYPDIHSLADATAGELAALLQPLGLAKRVHKLLEAAGHIRSAHVGEIPSGQAELEAVPGVGQYTAAAVRAFAFGERVVPPDVNILRFVSRLTGLPMVHPTRGSRELLFLASQLTNEHTGPAPEWILDFCRTVCRPRDPRCSTCAILERCERGRARLGGDEGQAPHTPRTTSPRPRKDP